MCLTSFPLCSTVIQKKRVISLRPSVGSTKTAMPEISAGANPLPEASETELSACFFVRSSQKKAYIRQSYERIHFKFCMHVHLCARYTIQKYFDSPPQKNCSRGDLIFFGTLRFSKNPIISNKFKTIQYIPIQNSSQAYWVVPNFPLTQISNS